MAQQYPPYDYHGNQQHHQQSSYSNPFDDSAPHSTPERHYSAGSQGYGDSTHLGGDLSGGQQRYQLSDGASSYLDSSATLPTGSFTTLPDGGVADDKSYGYNTQEDDDEARPLRDGFQGGGGGFYRPEGEQ